MSRTSIKLVLIKSNDPPPTQHLPLKIHNTPAGCWGISVGSIAIGLAHALFGDQSIIEAGLSGLLYLGLSLAVVYGCYLYIQKHGE